MKVVIPATPFPQSPGSKAERRSYPARLRSREETPDIGRKTAKSMKNPKWPAIASGGDLRGFRKIMAQGSQRDVVILDTIFPAHGGAF